MESDEDHEGAVHALRFDDRRQLQNCLIVDIGVSEALDINDGPLLGRSEPKVCSLAARVAFALFTKVSSFETIVDLIWSQLSSDQYQARHHGRKTR